ncbi:thermonuclease family protein [Candidatus Pelagibacter sp. Uisw_092]|uniref:thermonuclease family protein n=1 Tax=Candidatus Pelagibacter sp. Uisw_092 TaxID=3230979 RepID=UPI0039E7CF13
MLLNKKKAIFLISVSALIFILTINQVKSQTIKIVDGDTIHINGEKIRFTGIDTPEIKQTCINNGVKDPCGIKAKEILTEKIANNKVVCISEGKDQYKRTLAECFVNEESLSSYLVRSGYAFAYRKYSKKFIVDEDYAKINKAGMWSMNFDYPWDYRKKRCSVIKPLL